MKKVLLVTLCVILAAGALVGCAPQADANAPFKLQGDVELVCPYSAGGGSDLYARIAADVIQKNEWVDEAIMVINKPGGAGAVGDAYTFSKKGSDATLTTYVSAQITGPLMNKTDVTYKDLTPICNLAMDEYIIAVMSTAEFQTIDAFIEAAKAAPGTITVGGSGKGTEDELVTGLLEKYTGIDLEYVSYNSSAEVMSAMLGDHIDAGIYNPNECISQYEVGQCTILAAYGPERISMLPDVKTFTELGYTEVVFQQFRGIFGAPEMSDKALAYWADIFKKVTETDQWKTEYLAANGLTSKYMAGSDYDTFLDAEAAKYEAILADIGAI